MKKVTKKTTSSSCDFWDEMDEILLSSYSGNPKYGKYGQQKKDGKKKYATLKQGRTSKSRRFIPTLKKSEGYHPNNKKGRGANIRKNID